MVRGWPGKDAWGHPLEPTAQYNHQNERGARPPITPWRIEVGDASPGARTLFLHVFEIGNEGDSSQTEVELTGPAAIRIGEKWRVQFNPAAPIGAKIGERALTTEVHLESQYR